MLKKSDQVHQLMNPPTNLRTWTVVMHCRTYARLCYFDSTQIVSEGVQQAFSQAEMKTGFAAGLQYQLNIKQASLCCAKECSNSIFRPVKRSHTTCT